MMVRMMKLRTTTVMLVDDATDEDADANDDIDTNHEDNDDVYVNPSKKQEYIDLLGPELKSRYNEFKSTGRDPWEFDELII